MIYELDLELTYIASTPNPLRQASPNTSIDHGFHLKYFYCFAGICQLETTSQGASHVASRSLS